VNPSIRFIRVIAGCSSAVVNAHRFYRTEKIKVNKSPGLANSKKIRWINLITHPI
jgi:hypothetical protein